MSGRTPVEAVQRFLRGLRLTLSCVTQDVIAVQGQSGYRLSEQPHTVVLNLNRSTRLDRDPSLFLRLTIEYQIVQHAPGAPWRAAVTGYIYSFRDAADLELLAYHWHPRSESRVTWPHLHIHHRDPPLVTARTHLLSGVIYPQDLVRLAVEEFGVRPRRADWETVLSTTGQQMG